MAKKKDKNKVQDEKLDNYYKLNTDAVDRLINANDESTEIPQEEQHLTKTGFLAKIPYQIKALAIKWWFVSACYFFIGWGLGMFIQDSFALPLILGIVIGIVTDLLINNAFRFIQSSDKEYSNFMLIPKKAFWTFFVYIVYATIIVFFVVYTYDGINRLAISVGWATEEKVFLGVEPILFGVFYTIYDMIIIGIKNLIVYAVKHKKIKY